MVNVLFSSDELPFNVMNSEQMSTKCDAERINAHFSGQSSLNIVYVNNCLRTSHVVSFIAV